MRKSIAQLLAAVPESDMRMRRIAEFLCKDSAALVAIAIEKSVLEIHVAAQRVFYTTLIHLLFTIRPRPPLPAGPLPLEHRELLPSADRIAELIEVADQLHARFARTLLIALWQPPEKYDDKLLPLHVTIDHISLGHRRERARLPDRSRFAAILVDTTPSVVQILSLNTRLRQDDMVQMAAMRPQHPWALWTILLNFRWLSNDTVREAVALNPYAKAWTCFALTPLLGAEKMSRVVQKIGLPGELLSAMIPLHGGACSHAIREVLLRAGPEAGTLIYEIDETEAQAAEIFGDGDDLVALDDFD